MARRCTPRCWASRSGSWPTRRPARRLVRSKSRAIRTTPSFPTTAAVSISNRKATRGRCRWSMPERGRSSKEIGPFGNMVRPFTFNGAQTMLFANINDFLGFEVADLKTGEILYQVAVPGVTAGRSPTHGIPSHGIAMTHDETEIWIADNANNYLRVFDASVMPPAYKTSVKVHVMSPGWITFAHRRQARLSVDRRCRGRSHQTDRGDAAGRARRECGEREVARDRFRSGQATGGRRPVRKRQGARSGPASQGRARFSTTWPLLMMSSGFWSTQMCSSGLPSTAIRSASSPGSRLPVFDAIPSNSAPLIVAAWIAASGVSPASTRWAISPDTRATLRGRYSVSAPVANFTPIFTAR